MAQRFQNTNQLFSIQRTTLQRQLYKFKAQAIAPFRYRETSIITWEMEYTSGMDNAGGGKKAEYRM